MSRAVRHSRANSLRSEPDESTRHHVPWTGVVGMTRTGEQRGPALAQMKNRLDFGRSTCRLGRPPWGAEIPLAPCAGRRSRDTVDQARTRARIDRIEIGDEHVDALC